MSLLPPPFQAYDPVVLVVLLFVDGLLFGLAVKKAVVTIVLLVVAIVLAGVVGVSLPFLSASNIWTHVLDILASQARHAGAVFYGLPVFWLIGLAIGIWKG